MRANTNHKTDTSYQEDGDHGDGVTGPYRTPTHKATLLRLGVIAFIPNT